MSEATPTSRSANRRWLLWSGVFVLSVVGLILFRDPEGSRLNAAARKEWKTNAVASIERRLVDKAWLDKEMAAVKTKLDTYGEDAGGWFTEDILLLKNGDWIAYAAKCSKEDARIHDIFVGRASDGKWYYSTFHFCIGMFDLRREGRTENLAQFISAYSLREFDGRSDECLKKTWPTPKP